MIGDGEYSSGDDGDGEGSLFGQGCCAWQAGKIYLLPVESVLCAP